MTGDSDKFLSLEKQKGKVTFGDNASGNILGKGTVKVGKNKAQNVLLVENLKLSLLSVNQTCDQGHICVFDSQKCEVVKKKTGKVVAIALKTAKNVYIYIKHRTQ